jgi:hypothetical protein
VSASSPEVVIPIIGTLEKPQIDRSKLGNALKAFAIDGVLGIPAGDSIRRNIEDGTRGVVRGIDNGLDRLMNPRRN